MKNNALIWGLIVIVVILLALVGYKMVSDQNNTKDDNSGLPTGENVGQENQRNPLNVYQEYAKRNHEEFKIALETKIVSEFGQPIEGFVPQMFLQKFTKLSADDFDGVQAMIGHYEYVNGELIHDLEGEEMIHSAADAITEHGYEILLQNVAERLNFSEHDGIYELIAEIEDVAIEDEEVSGESSPQILPKNKEIVCTDQMKQAEACTMEYAPVCGMVEVQCITAPCDPVPETFSNGCSACSQGNVVSYTEGECLFSN